WDVRTGRQLRQLGPQHDKKGFTSLSFGRDDDRLLACGSRDGTATVWDVDADGDQPLCTLVHGDEVYAVAFHPADWEFLVTAEVVRLEGETRKVRSWSLRGEKADGAELKVGCPREGEVLDVWRPGDGVVRALAVAKQRIVAAGGERGRLRLWDGHA